MQRIRENLVVFGGRDRNIFLPSIYLLDLCTLVWSTVALRSGPEHPQNKALLARAEFACAGSRFEDRIFIFGGINGNFELMSEMLVLHFD